VHFANSKLIDSFVHNLQNHLLFIGESTEAICSATFNLSSLKRNFYTILLEEHFQSALEMLDLERFLTVVSETDQSGSVLC
jgi:hypothetical protein